MTVMRTSSVWSALLIVAASGCGGATTSPSNGNDGGTSGSGGGGGSGGGPVECTVGSVTFELTAAGSPSFTFCTGHGCSSEWVTVKSSTGQVIQLSRPCAAICGSNQPGGCTLACALP